MSAYKVGEVPVKAGPGWTDISIPKDAEIVGFERGVAVYLASPTATNEVRKFKVVRAGDQFECKTSTVLRGFSAGQALLEMA